MNRNDAKCGWAPISSLPGPPANEIATRTECDRVKILVFRVAVGGIGG
jgi:hypothetical protein